MKSVLKTSVIFLVIIIFCAVLLVPQTCEGKKSKKNALSPEDFEKLTVSVNMLVKKVYSHSLFSPADNNNLFDAKMKVDVEIENPAPDATYAELVYKIAFILKQREFKDDAIDYYRTIMDKFPDSAYVPKAAEALRQLGVKMDAAAEGSDSEE